MGKDNFLIDNYSSDISSRFCFYDNQIHSFIPQWIYMNQQGLINAIFANSFDDISIVPTFVLTPLTYLGGVFYSIEMLPELWQNISLFNPVLYMVNGFRMGMLGVSDASLTTAILIILGFIALLGSIALWLLHTGVGIKK